MIGQKSKAEINAGCRRFVPDSGSRELRNRPVACLMLDIGTALRTCCFVIEARSLQDSETLERLEVR